MPFQRESSRWPRWGIPAAVVLLCGVALILAGRYDYLLFHALAETFSVVIAAGIFMIAWNTREIQQSNYLQFLGLSYLFVAGIDMAHMLAYKGMGVFTGHSNNLPTQLWIVARSIEGLALVTAPIFLDRPMSARVVFLGLLGVSAALVGSIFLGVFPRCYVDGQGLTLFKRVTEYAICALLLLAAVELFSRRRRLDAKVFGLVLGSILVTVASELSFTLYQDPYGGLNQLGHGLKIVSFYLIYKAIIETGLRQPYSLLFRDLAQNAEALARSNQELDLYAHTVSHDLKNPLAGVVTGALAMDRMLVEPPTAETIEDLQKMAGVVVRGGRKAVRLVDDLLALAEAGQEPAAVEPVDVGQVVASALEDQATAVAERGIAVEVDPELGRVVASPTHIYQLFVNLISNVIAHASGERLVIQVRRLGGTGGEHRFLVRDNGRGIPQEHLARIFDPFFKGTTGRHGLGLATVAKIVGVYGGTIRAYNDGGACFELTLRDRG